MYKNTWILEGLLKGDKIAFSFCHDSLNFVQSKVKVIIYFDRSVSKGYHFNAIDIVNKKNDTTNSSFWVKSKGRFAVIILQSPFDINFEMIKIKILKDAESLILKE